MKRSGSFLRWGVCLSFALACAACAKGAVPPYDDPREKAPPAPPKTAMHRLGEVQRASLGPYRAQGEEGSLVVFASSGDLGAMLFTQGIFPDGSPKGAARSIGNMPFETRAMTATRLGKGFVVSYTSPVGESDAIVSIVLNDDGKAVGTPIELVKTPNPISWFQMVTSASGVILVWAESTANENASLFALAADAHLSPLSVPTRIARNAVSWQLHETNDGVTLGTISASAAALGKASSYDIVLQAIDREGRLKGAPWTLAKDRHPARDLDFSESTGTGFAAWTELDGGVPRPMRVVLSPGAKASEPEVIAAAKGGGRVVSLLKHALLWRDAVSASRVYLTDLRKPDAIRYILDTDDGKPPELTAFGDDFALVGTTRLCPESQSNADACDRLPKRPTFARLRGDLTVTNTIAVSKLCSDGVEPTFSWGLSCANVVSGPGGAGATSECAFLGSTGTQNLMLYAIHVDPSASEGKAPPKAVPNEPPSAPPRASALPGPSPSPAPAPLSMATGSLGASAVALPGFSAAAFSGAAGPFVAVLGEREGKKAAGDDQEIVIVPADGATKGGEPISITKRAAARGGVALAQGGSAKDGYALAWVALEQGDPEVHLSRLDKTGHRTSDMLLTTVKGDARNVAVEWVGDGYVVAWIDGRGRDGAGEVYATKVNPSLERITRQTRVGSTPGDATDLAMVRGIGPKGPLFLAWTKPSGASTSDVYLARISAHNAERQGEEIKVTGQTGAGGLARAPLLLPTDEGGVRVAWLVDQSAGRGNQVDQAFFASAFDALGQPSAPTRLVWIAPGARASAWRASRERGALALLLEGSQASLVGLRPWDAAPAPTRLVTGLAKRHTDVGVSASAVWYPTENGSVVRALLPGSP